MLIDLGGHFLEGRLDLLQVGSRRLTLSSRLIGKKLSTRSPFAFQGIRGSNILPSIDRIDGKSAQHPCARLASPPGPATG